jgi:hypothetical protein
MSDGATPGYPTRSRSGGGPTSNRSRFHHDPVHDDAMLDRFEAPAKEQWRSLGRDPTTACLAREQIVFNLGE